MIYVIRLFKIHVVFIIVENSVEESCEMIRFLDNDCDLTLKVNFNKERGKLEKVHLSIRLKF